MHPKQLLLAQSFVCQLGTNGAALLRILTAQTSAEEVCENAVFVGLECVVPSNAKTAR